MRIVRKQILSVQSVVRWFGAEQILYLQVILLNIDTNVIVAVGRGLDIKYLTINKNHDIIKYKGSKAPLDLIFPLWFCKLLEPIEYKTDKDYGEGYYGHYYGYPIYYVPNEIPEE